MGDIDYNTLIVTVVGLLGSAGAWQYYTHRMELKSKETREDKKEQTLYRDDLKERVLILETKLDEERNNVDNYRQQLMDLTSAMTEYKVRLEFLERENLELKAKNR